MSLPEAITGEPWTWSDPLFLTARVETVQGETARYAPAPSGEARLFGQFTRTWPFHYGCLPGAVSTGDESVLPGPESEDLNWVDVVICGGDFLPCAPAECRVVGIALRRDGDHKLLTAAADDPALATVMTADDLPPGVCQTVAEWFAAQGAHFEFAGIDQAWQVLQESLASAAVPVRRYWSAGGLVVHEDRVLLLERPERREVRLPKGHVERGESLEEAARRETHEESGLRGLDFQRFLGTARNLFFYDQHLVVRDESYCLYRWRGKRAKKSESQFQRRWVAWPEAESRLTFAVERYFLRQAREAALEGE